MSSNLYYFGTTDDVRVGDYVEICGWFGRVKRGEVIYLPGISPPHPDFEYADVKQWVIRDEDGNAFPILYDPENFQPPKKFRLIRRGTAKPVNPGERFE